MGCLHGFCRYRYSVRSIFNLVSYSIRQTMAKGQPHDLTLWKKKGKI